MSADRLIMIWLLTVLVAFVFYSSPPVHNFRAEQLAPVTLLEEPASTEFSKHGHHSISDVTLAAVAPAFKLEALRRGSNAASQSADSHRGSALRI